MRRALRLAARGWGQTAPNPMVGAVVVRDGALVGEGFHARAGAPHAEVVALHAAGAAAQGATLYVTLEPCDHHGRTPPCTAAILAAGIARVVFATSDPNPVAAGGRARLSAAGLVVASGVEEEEARELNAVFLHHAQGATRPFVTLKLALSLDGAIALADRQRRWITGVAARRHVHRLRAQADAIGVGRGTAVADDPALTVRHGRRPLTPPARIVFDRQARLPLDLVLVRTARKVPTWVLATAPDPTHVTRLESAGVRLLTAPDLPSQLALLHQEGVRHLFVEGGEALASALVGAELVDRLVIFRGPVLFGAGALPAFSSLASSSEPLQRWRLVHHRRFGDDVMDLFAPPGR